MKLSGIFFVILLCLAACCAAFGEEEFHSEFGYLPPEVPSGSGMTAEVLNGLLEQIDEAGLPPSHRLRRVYEWMMSRYRYEADDSCLPDDQDAESVSACLIGITRSSGAGDSGFALLSHYLLDRMGFPSVIISGELTLPDGSSEEHRWNYVFYSGKWYHFDPLGEMRNPELNGFMNVEKDLTGAPLRWNREGVPGSAEYAVRAIGCSCDF